MGFIKAISEGLSSTLADQWEDYYTPRAGVPATAAVFQAVSRTQNNSRGENYKGNENIITNGSKIAVPEGTALITLQDGEITGVIAEPGGYEFRSDDPNSKSVFAGDGLLGELIKSTWEKVKFGGQPGSQQLAFYVNLKEIPNNKFGTQSPVYYHDAWLNTRAGIITRGSYTLKIVDPILFVKNFVPAKYLQPNSPTFDLSDMGNEASEQLFNEVVGSLGGALSRYSREVSGGSGIDAIQGDQVGFAKSLSAAVEEMYTWRSDRGLEIIKTAIISIEYDDKTLEQVDKKRELDVSYGSGPDAGMRRAYAESMMSAAKTGGGSNLAFLGVGMNAMNGIMGNMQQLNNQPQQPYYQQSQPQQPYYQQNQPQQPYYQQNQPQQPTQNQPQQFSEQPLPTQQEASNNDTTNVDPKKKLLEAKELLDAGIISQEEYDKIKSQLLPMLGL